MSGGFERNTRQKSILLPALARPTGGGVSTLELPKTGFLARIFLQISGSIAGSLSGANTLGMSSIVKRVKVTTNSGIDLFNISGPGYGYLYQNFQDLQQHASSPANQYNTAVTATTFNLNMVIPLMLNMHDPIGMIMLQNEQLQVLLSVEWEADATVATGATVTATATPVAEFFTVPRDKADWPPLNVVHQTIEDQIAIGATGDYIYNLPRGNTYLQILLGYVLGVSGTAADSWSRAIMRINQSDILYDVSPASATARMGYVTGLTRGLGAIPFDFLGSDGLGNYGSARDFINSALLTDFQIVLTATATGTLYVVRRMLLPLASGG
jgi:hypothetical protein